MNADMYIIKLCIEMVCKKQKTQYSNRFLKSSAKPCAMCDKPPLYLLVYGTKYIIPRSRLSSCSHVVCLALGNGLLVGCPATDGLDLLGLDQTGVPDAESVNS